MSSIKKHITGGVYDCELPSKSLAIINKLNAPHDLAEKIGHLVGRYRMMKSARDTAPSPSEAIGHLENTCKSLDRLLECINLMPEDFKAVMSDRLWQPKAELYEGLESRIVRDLCLLRALCDSARDDVVKSRGGEKPKTLEHRLFSDVAYLLEAVEGVNVSAAAFHAAQILIHSGVQNMPGWDKGGGNVGAVPDNGAARNTLNKIRKSLGC